MKTILVIGAGGYFGGLLVEELLQFCQCRLILAGRNLEQLQSIRRNWPENWRDRTDVKRIDLNDGAAVDAVMPHCQIAICAAGPFQDLPHTLLYACLNHNVHYVDLSDNRAFVLQANKICHEYMGQSQVAVASGWSAVPALSALLAALAAKNMERVEALRIQIAPGNRAPRSYSTVASLLDSLGQPFKIWRHDEWVEVTGWSEPSEFKFPAPVGCRMGALVDVPDLELFPSLFCASSVEFRVGAELQLLNYASFLLAQSVKSGIIPSCKPWAGQMQKMMALFGRFGHDWGAVGVECHGFEADQAVTRRACVVADHRGHQIPVMPAVILCEQLLRGDTDIAGVPPLGNWLNKDELDNECKRRGYRLIVE